MFRFDYIDDSRFITNEELKDQILNTIDQKSIFELIFGTIDLSNKYCSPFRKDHDPGCYFWYDKDGILLFVDWANNTYNQGIHMQRINCFEAIQLYYKLDTINDALDFIVDKIVNHESVKKLSVCEPMTLDKQKKHTIIHSEFRNFERRDERYWGQYGITTYQLQEDFVFPVNRYSITKKNTYWYRPRTICYSLGLFNNGKQKLYFPKNRHQYRFITNCSTDDIGMIDRLPDTGKQLIITKSYKDYRVLKNFGCTVIWFQNEVTCPSDYIMIDLANRFDSIVIFFDSDETGVRNSIKVCNTLNKVVKATCFVPLWVSSEEGVKDPSDLYAKKGPMAVQSFLYENKII